MKRKGHRFKQGVCGLHIFFYEKKMNFTEYPEYFFMTNQTMNKSL